MIKINNWGANVKTHKARDSVMMLQCFSSSSPPALGDVFTVAQLWLFNPESNG